MMRRLERLKNREFGAVRARVRLVDSYSIKQGDLDEVFLKVVNRESAVLERMSKSTNLPRAPAIEPGPDELRHHAGTESLPNAQRSVGWA